MNQDLKIARKFQLDPIVKIGEDLGLHEDELFCYGTKMAKVLPSAQKRLEDQKDGKLILVTAINPTSAGEGKSTITIGLADGLKKIGKSVCGCLREPSLGPVFGLKGGATGGGYSQVVPMEEINLHFTGDMHALTCANNLIAAALDNSIYQGNPLEIDLDKIVFKRCLDMNDRSLRDITIGQGKKINGVERKDHFCITVASELMAILCLCKDEKDLLDRVSRMVVAYDVHGNEVSVKDLGVDGAVCVVLKQAIQPNLVQTLYHTPFLVHGGPFANIAHGCNSLIATKLALKLSDYVVTEAGFGADLGAEKFFDIKCRMGNLHPSCVVLVATIKALKLHGGKANDQLDQCDVEALSKGLENLYKHMETIESYGLPFVVCLNHFAQDDEKEVQFFLDTMKEKNIPVSLSNGYQDGPDGTIDLAEMVVQQCEKENQFHSIYEDSDDLKTKILKIATTVYGAKDVVYSNTANEKLEMLNKYSNVPVCIAKTPLSLSDDKTLINRPRDFSLHVQDVSLSKGAGFIVVYTGSILTMPGLPKHPAANDMGLDEDGEIFGLF